MANQVTIEIDDETKRLTAGEMLATGSVYDVTMAGISFGVGSSQTLFVTSQGRLLAYAPLTAGSGVLSIDTREVADEVGHMPVGAVVEFDMSLHSNAAGAPEMVATGRIAVRCASGTWNDNTSGAIALYKGTKGDTGNGVTGIRDEETDADGNRKVKVIYGDGSENCFMVPIGVAGADHTDMVAFYPTENGGDGKWHKVSLVKTNEGTALTVDESEAGAPTVTVPGALTAAVTAAETSEQDAADSADEAEDSENETSDSADAAEDSKGNAATKAGEAAASAEGAAASAAAAAASAAAAAAAASAAAASAAIAEDASTSNVGLNVYDISSISSGTNIEHIYFVEISRDVTDASKVWGKLVFTGVYNPESAGSTGFNGRGIFIDYNVLLAANSQNLFPFKLSINYDDVFLSKFNANDFPVPTLPSGGTVKDLVSWSTVSRIDYPGTSSGIPGAETLHRLLVSFGRNLGATGGGLGSVVVSNYMRLEVEGYFYENWQV